MRRIDVHQHYLAKHYLDAVGLERITAASTVRSVPQWSAGAALELMDRVGIEAALLSVSDPGVGLETEALTARLARACNEGQARIASDYPRRFGFCAALPLPSVTAALREIEYALDELHADGVGMLTNYGGIYAGDAEFWPVFEELDRRGAVLFVHPTAPAGRGGFAKIASAMLEFPFDTTRAIASFLYHGTAARFPNLRIIWSHGGGAMPYLAGRTAVVSARDPAFRQSGPDRLLPALRGFYYDLTQSVSPPTFAALRALVPDTNLLFGSDRPFAAENQLNSALADFARLDLSEAERRAINRDNALALFPRFGASY
ncbi:MAG: amidohydrolase [Betaproteobacteria bacterium]|nr:amidohydrolase [Betaproteobacteria bacterium]